MILTSKATGKFFLKMLWEPRMYKWSKGEDKDSEPIHSIHLHGHVTCAQKRSVWK